MLKPSYSDLMTELSKNSEKDITSRYSIVIAASKRARQLVDGAKVLTSEKSVDKPVSISTQELYEGHFKLVSHE